MNKGLEQLTEEGVAQLFIKEYSGDKLLGVVGMLQFEVIQHRLKEEYKASVRFEQADYGGAAWIEAEDSRAMEQFMRFHGNHVALDKDEERVFYTVTAGRFPGQWRRTRRSGSILLPTKRTCWFPESKLQGGFV